jgi:hypothetical protein
VSSELYTAKHESQHTAWSPQFTRRFWVTAAPKTDLQGGSHPERNLITENHRFHSRLTIHLIMETILTITTHAQEEGTIRFPFRRLLHHLRSVDVRPMALPTAVHPEDLLEDILHLLRQAIAM